MGKQRRVSTLIREQKFATVNPMGDRLAGLLVTVDDEGGRLLSEGFARRVQVNVGTVAEHFLTVMVLDTGEWVLTEVDLARSPRIIARGQLPSSRYDEDHHEGIGH
jgi:hypothetical protein